MSCHYWPFCLTERTRSTFDQWMHPKLMTGIFKFKTTLASSDLCTRHSEKKCQPNRTILGVWAVIIGLYAFQRGPSPRLINECTHNSRQGTLNSKPLWGFIRPMYIVHCTRHSKKKSAKSDNIWVVELSLWAVFAFQSGPGPCWINECPYNSC